MKSEAPRGIRMADPQQGRRGAREAARNASSGIRRRLRVFLSTDAIRVIRAGGLAWVVMAAGVAAGLLLIVTEFARLSYGTTITATCSAFAHPGPPARGPPGGN